MPERSTQYTSLGSIIQEAVVTSDKLIFPQGSSSSTGAATHSPPEKVPRTYVLVHGAFHGGWCWRAVAERLRAQGHRVFTPTFTGLGERSEGLNPAIDLNTFIKDIKAVIEVEELQAVILVGHSFGGYVISGVIDQLPDRIAGVVYLDAPMGTNGESVFDGTPNDVRKARTDAAITIKGTQAIAPPSATSFGLSDSSQLAWVNRRMTPMPLKSYTTPLLLTGKPGGELPKKFVHSINPVLPNIVASANYAKQQGWQYAEISTGHDAMVSKPEEVALILSAFGEQIQK